MRYPDRVTLAALPRPRVLALVLLAVVAGGRTPAPAAAAGNTKRTPALEAALAAGGARPRNVWVFFRDKGQGAAGREAEAAATVTSRALARRAARGQTRGLTLEDVPLARTYVEAVAARVTRVRHQVRWVNAMSVEATPEQVASVAALPFVARVDLVRGYRGRPEEDLRDRAAVQSGGPRSGCAPACADRSAAAFDYGPSAGQLTQIGVPAAHAMGLHGEGVMVAVLDAGFDTLSHEAFAAMSIVDTHDFVNGDEDVADGRDRGNGSHGTETLSVLGGWAPGHLIGPAFNATYILAKTEDTTSETPVEEDNWASAAEWAEAHGADVISSSLGYLDFDPGFLSYGFADMDGLTAISTRAADLAGERGVVVVNSAGNSGLNAAHNTLGAPADGRLVLAVGAVMSNGQRASFSSVGPSSDGRIKPDVSAQGVAVVAAAPRTASGYTAVNGTSFSCPLTAGVVALLIQAKPTASVAEIQDALRATASQAERPDNLLGWGIVDAGRAVERISR